MPEETKKEWIVLINRAPKGPLVEEEVRALIDEGIIRRNDLACIVPPDKAQKSEWKFLWQFREFDRRIENVVAANVATSSEVIPGEAAEDRRAPVHNEVLSFKAKTLLPEDIASIKTEDLLLHSTSFTSKTEPELSEEDVKLKEFSNQERTRPEIIFSGLIMLVVMLFFFVKALKTDNEKTAATPAKNMQLPIDQKSVENRAPANTGKRPAASALVPTVAAKKVETPRPPEARDNGEIAYEEYRRKRDAEIERERQKEEEERNAEKQDEENSDEDKPKKKNRDKASEDDASSNNDGNEDNPVSDDPRSDEGHPED